MQQAEIRAPMHPYSAIPLASMLGAAVLASAIAAREPNVRANRLVSLLLLCAGYWSLCDLLRNLAPDAELATVYLRWSGIGSLMLGPLMLHLIVNQAGPALERLRPALPLSYLASTSAALASLSTDWLVVGAERTAWGWSEVPGPAVPVVYAVVAGFPLTALGLWAIRRPWRWPDATVRNLSVALGGLACFVAASLTDFLLPLLGIQAPRLGSASLVAWGGVVWWSVYRFREPRLAPHHFAREILETLPDGVALVRLDGRIRASNAAFEALAQRPAEQLRGLPIEELLVGVPDGGTEDEGERECELVARDETRIPVSVWGAPLADDDGQVIGRVLVLRDLRELVDLRSRLVSAGRLAAVGQLAAGIAHEINNPIAYVRSNLSLLSSHWGAVGAALEKLGPADDVRASLEEGPELLSEATDGVDRVAGFVRDVGGFSRSGSTERELVRMDELLDTALRVAAPQLKMVEVERAYGDLPLVPCVSQELMQVFLNLLLNASQSCDGNGSIRLLTRTEDVDAVVEVIDNGPGIEEELLGRIFEPFFTTKPVGKGTGLGLSISRQIVAKHGGSLSVESSPGTGACFRVRIPLKSGSGEPS